MLQREELLNDCDIEYIVESLGIPIKKRGRYTDILCPKHADSNFGSCKVNVKNNTCHCFVCNETMTVFDLVMNVNKCSYFEAFKYVAESTGRAEDYIIQDVKIEKNEVFPLSKEVIQMLDVAFLTVKDIENLSSIKPEKGYFESTNFLYVCSKNQKHSIQELWRKNKFLFKTFVSYKIYLFMNEKKEIYNWLNIDDDFESWECIRICKDIIRELSLKDYIEYIIKANTHQKKLHFVQTQNKALPF